MMKTIVSCDRCGYVQGSVNLWPPDGDLSRQAYEKDQIVPVFGLDLCGECQAAASAVIKAFRAECPGTHEYLAAQAVKAHA